MMTNNPKTPKTKVKLLKFDHILFKLLRHYFLQNQIRKTR